MKAFVFYVADNLTRDYHSGGSALVIAEDEAAALDALESERPDLDDGDEEATPKLTYWFEAGPDARPHIIIFPDAGCC